MAILTTRNLGKRYGEAVGIEQVDLAVDAATVEPPAFLDLPEREGNRWRTELDGEAGALLGIAVLLIVGGAFWIAGLEITARRSLCTT